MNKRMRAMQAVKDELLKRGRMSSEELVNYEALQCPYDKAIVTQAYVGWHVSTARGSRRCKTRQEAYDYLQRFMRKADLKRKRGKRASRQTK